MARKTAKLIRVNPASLLIRTNNMNLRRIVFALVVICVLFVGVAATLVGRTVSTNTVKNEIYDHLIATAESRINSIELTLLDCKQAAEIVTDTSNENWGVWEPGLAELPQDTIRALGLGYLKSMVYSFGLNREYEIQELK